MNGTLKDLLRKVDAFRAANGRNLDGLWISQERWNMLPQATREGFAPGPGYISKRPLTVAGVPVRVFEVLDPVEAFTRAPGSPAQGGFDPSARYGGRPEA